MNLSSVMALLAVALLREGDVCPTGPAVTVAQLPIYPVVALKARMEGFAMVDVTIGEEGEVLDATAQGVNPLLAAAGRRAAGGWRFTPDPGAGVRCATLLFRFVLKPDGADEPWEAVTTDSPHSITVISEPYPSVVTVLVDPSPMGPCLVNVEPWSTTFCERALVIMPIR